MTRATDEERVRSVTCLWFVQISRFGLGALCSREYAIIIVIVCLHFRAACGNAAHNCSTICTNMHDMNAAAAAASKRRKSR